jgi:hypothetical protein
MTFIDTAGKAFLAAMYRQGKLISGMGRLIGLRLARALEGAEPWRSPRPSSFDRESSSVSWLALLRVRQPDHS